MDEQENLQFYVREGIITSFKFSYKCDRNRIEAKLWVCSGFKDYKFEATGLSIEDATNSVFSEANDFCRSVNVGFH